MSDLLPCRFCGAAPHAWLDDYINGRIVPDPYYIVECENADCSVYPEIRGIWPRTDEVRAMWNAANALPALQPDARCDALTAERDARIDPAQVQSMINAAAPALAEALATAEAEHDRLRGGIEHVLDGYGLSGPDYRFQDGEDGDWITDHLISVMKGETS